MCRILNFRPSQSLIKKATLLSVSINFKKFGKMKWKKHKLFETNILSNPFLSKSRIFERSSWNTYRPLWSIRHRFDFCPLFGVQLSFGVLTWEFHVFSSSGYTISWALQSFIFELSILFLVKPYGFFLFFFLETS